MPHVVVSGFSRTRRDSTIHRISSNAAREVEASGAMKNV